MKFGNFKHTVCFSASYCKQLISPCKIVETGHNTDSHFDISATTILF